MAEYWRDIAGFDGVYQVSNCGNVRRAQRGYQGRAKAKVLAASVNSSGYPLVLLYQRGVRKVSLVHRLVAEAFLGPAPNGAVVCHNNGNPSDNRVENLRWGTQSDNISDSVKHGTHRNTRKVECLRGHPLSGENLYLRANGRRECRTCIRDRVRRRSLTVL